MSNNLVSQQLSILNGDMGQLEPAYVNVDSSVLNMRMGMMGPMSTDAATHQFPISNQQMQLVDQMSYIPGSQNLTVSNKHLGNMEPTLDNMGSQKLLPIQKDRETEASLNNLGSQKLLYPNKRKAVVEPMFNNSVQQQISMPNKRAAHMEPHLSSPGSLHHSATNKKAMHLQSISSASGSQNSPAPNKKMVRNESISNKSGTQRVQTPKGRTVQMEAPRKIQSESFESVRSKMRESLAAALALVRQNQNKTPKQEKSSPHKVDITPSQTSEDSKLAESTSTPVDAAGIPENMHSKGSCSADKPSDGQNSFAEASTHEGVVNSPHPWKSSGQDSLYNTVLPDGDVSFTDNFFVKDELLQGNGLSWAWDMVIEAVEPKEVQAAKHVDVGEDGGERKVRSPECLTFKNEAEEGQAAKHVDASGDGGEKNLQSPENLAFKIEVELFKLFGGVNKKYKEKGRSLMFNLKDRNNPELRERVMSGEISPEKLCSMTAEELASKELSEWRMAKAEELAQMIVLPDSDGDRRRLVKKTHKGEYQVEVEQDDSVSVEVSVGTTTFTQILPKDKETVAPSSSENEDVKDTKNVESEKGSLDNQDSCSLTIPADGTDLMQGLIEDEFKDAEFLPPIVSLDEFMESLNSEPPFDNLAVDAGQTKPSSEKVKSETGDKVVASNPASKDSGDTKLGKATKIDTKIKELELDIKSSDHPVEQKHSTPDKTSMAEHVWEGALQLQISASVTVIGLFRSGEKTSTKEWASSLEIKGRVRLDAFEKFLQELPMSRSRAVMVVHFVLKPGSSEDDRASLREVIDSYVLDERLGFAEPTAGMELYLSPPHPKILEMLGKHLSKDQTEIIKSTDNGLIGVVVWRRAHISSTISPNSTSHHKHSSKKQQHLMSRRQEKDTNVNVNMTSRTPIPFGQPPVRSGPTPNNDLDDDDIPPGFGPGAARDDDDLPEFNFSGNSTSSVPGRVSSQPSRLTSFNPHQMRELIQKYGQTGHSDNSPRTWQDKGGVGHGIQAWNNDDDDNDDDDDIPEWRPDVPQQQIPAPSLTVHSFHQPMHPHMVNQPLGSSAPHHLMSQQVGVQPVAMPPTNMNINPSWQQGGRWARPQGFQPGSLGSQLNVGQLYGTSSVPRAGQPPGNWRQDAPRSRGF